MGRLAGVLILTLGVILLGVGYLGSTGALEAWGQRLAERRDSLRQGKPEMRTDENGSPVPPVIQPGDLATVLAQMPELSTALALINSAELLPTLPKPTTLFLPSNAAFAALPPEALTALQNNPDILLATLRHHAVRGRVPAAEIVRFDVMPTLNGSSLPVTVSGTTAVGGASITAVNHRYADGLVHVVDRVLLPENSLLQPSIQTPDGQTEVMFKGDWLTVVGSAEPFTRIVLNRNGQPFGEAAVSAEGRWEIAAAITPGTHAFVAYMLNSNPASPLPLGISETITLLVE